LESIGRYFQGTSQSFFLFGPRGTGKATWVQQYTQHTQFIDLLSPDIFRAFVAKPERLKEIVDPSHQPQTIVIDEIQKVPELLAVVHQLIEENKNRQFILTGSSSRKLKRSGVDLMAGRAIVKSMHPFMASELGDRFNLKEAMTWGLIPLIWYSPDRSETLRSYLTLYLKEEVQQEGIVRDIGGFSRFLESASFSNGSVLNDAEVARDCQVVCGHGLRIRAAKAKTELDELKLNESERRDFERFQKELHYQASMFESSWDDGHRKGREEGIWDTKRLIARSLLDTLEDETIANKTGLSLSEIQTMRKTESGFGD
jgi:predicted AAA+ superfamily ATPase